MSDIDLTDGPEIGEEILAAVHQGANRSTFFPDQVITVSTTDYVELIMLRQEIIVRAQTGKVVDKREGQVRVEFQPQPPRPEIFDIGHLRMAPVAALDMAMTIIAQQVESQSLDLDAIMQRLQSMTVEGT